MNIKKYNTEQIVSIEFIDETLAPFIYNTYIKKTFRKKLEQNGHNGHNGLEVGRYKYIR